MDEKQEGMVPYTLTEKEVEEESKKMVEDIQKNKIPQMKMSCNGTKRREVTAEEFEIAADLIFNR